MKKVIITLIFILTLIILSSAEAECNIYKKVSTNEKIVALSFDDGPHKSNTDIILNILDDHDIKATFFVVGKNAELYSDILRRICAEGHEIGNHTYSHRITGKNINADESDMQKNHRIILDICEYDVRLFRPPGGVLNKGIKNIAGKLGYDIILWDVDTRDWAHTSPDAIYRNVIENTKSGSIILFHDYISDYSPTAEAISKIIPELQDQGYKFVTVGELLEYHNVKTNS